MKYLFILLFGIFVGIGGELLIPKNLYTTIGGGCLTEKGSKYVYMPTLMIYDPTNKEYPYPLPALGYPTSFVPSYRYAYALLTKEIVSLSQDNCNTITAKLTDSKRKK